jgi:hypothetical protein
VKKVAIVFAGCLIVLGIGLSWEAPLAIVFGWIPFLMRVLPRATVDWPSVVLACVCFVLFAAGLHGLGRAWQRRYQAGQPPERSRRWKLRWSLAGVVIVTLLFAAGISVVGIVHLGGWLLTADHLLGESMARSLGGSDAHLKEVGMGIHYHASAYGGDLPPGASFTPEGVMLHSWQTQVLPYIGFSTGGIDFQRPWNDPVNEKYFKCALIFYINPDFRTTELVDANGFGLSHYAANSHVMGGNKATKLGDLPNGTANTLMVGEVNARFKPWGQPGNWRDPMRGINQSPYGFGGPPGEGGAQFLMVNGSVRFLSERTSPEVLRALSNASGKASRLPEE